MLLQHKNSVGVVFEHFIFVTFSVFYIFNDVDTSNPIYILYLK